MAMRVHELAKEFGMTSKELLEHLAQMKIPAKNHASTLHDAYVDKIRKNLGPELQARAQAIEAAKAEEEARQRAEEEARLKAEEEERRRAMEAEKAAREAERAAREAEEAAAREEELERKRLPKTPAFSGLLSQIEAEQKRLEDKKAEEEAAAAAAAAAVAAFDASGIQVDAPASTAPADQKQGKGEGGRRKKGKKPSASERYAAQLQAEQGDAGEGEDRYKQMAVAAEKLQRDKALADARAAVAAAQSEGEGRRKKRKQKREAEAKERALNEAIEKGISPVCTVKTARPHVKMIGDIYKNIPIVNFPEEEKIYLEDKLYVRDLQNKMLEAYEKECMLSEL